VQILKPDTGADGTTVAMKFGNVAINIYTDSYSKYAAGLGGVSV
jgi:hypothetical protein